MSFYADAAIGISDNIVRYVDVLNSDPSADPAEYSTEKERLESELNYECDLLHIDPEYLVHEYEQKCKRLHVKKSDFVLRFAVVESIIFDDDAAIEEELRYRKGRVLK